MEKALNSRVTLYIFIVLVGMLISICIFPPQLVFAKRISDYTVHIMIGLLIMGMFFLLLEQNKLMFASFAYCGILCLFLKGNVNQSLKLATTSGTPTITVAHFNAGAAAGDYSYLIQAIEDSQADLITINELTPDWDYNFEQDLREEYPYVAKLVRIDPFGLGIFSKRPLSNVDTLNFYNEDHNHLSVTLPIGLQKDVQVVTSYFLPPLTRKEYGDYRVELIEMGRNLSKLKGPVIVTGDYNLSDWSAELREFKSLSGLVSSRRDVTPNSSKGLKTWMNFPVDHILFNARLECSQFETINDTLDNHLGIMGSYQIRPDQLKRFQ